KEPCYSQAGGRRQRRKGLSSHDELPIIRITGLTDSNHPPQGQAPAEAPMLTHLSVLNFATVDSLELEPARGLTVITGETGAGKSVIIDALGLALGERADSAVVRPDCERAEVQATFDLHAHPAARAWLAERELDDGDECMLRRTVRPDGRSRAWINGSPMPPQDARELGEMLISIHSQHDHQAPLRRDAHRRPLDRYAG